MPSRLASVKRGTKRAWGEPGRGGPLITRPGGTLHPRRQRGGRRPLRPHLRPRLAVLSLRLRPGRRLSPYCATSAPKMTSRGPARATCAARSSSSHSSAHTSHLASAPPPSPQPPQSPLPPPPPQPPLPLPPLPLPPLPLPPLPPLPLPPLPLPPLPLPQLRCALRVSTGSTAGRSVSETCSAPMAAATRPATPQPLPSSSTRLPAIAMAIAGCCSARAMMTPAGQTVTWSKSKPLPSPPLCSSSRRMLEGWNSRTAGRVNLSSYEAHSRHAASSSAGGAPVWLPPSLIRETVSCGAVLARERNTPTTTRERPKVQYANQITRERESAGGRTYLCGIG